MITDSDVTVVRTALEVLLKTNAPLGVLYHQFLQDPWVARQLSSSNGGDTLDNNGGANSSGSGGGLFKVASVVYCAAEQAAKQEKQESLKQAGGDQENQHPPITPTSTNAISRVVIDSTNPMLSPYRVRVVAEYILARLYSHVPLGMNPFLIHFLRVYVQQSGQGSIRYLIQRVFSSSNSSSEISTVENSGLDAGLSSLPVSLIVDQCVNTKLDLYGNILDEASSGTSSSEVAKRKKPQVLTATVESSNVTVLKYNGRFIGSLSIEWISRVLQDQGLEYSDILTALRPEQDAIEILDRLSGVLKEYEAINEDTNNETKADASGNDMNLDQDQGQGSYFNFNGDKSARLEVLAAEANILGDIFAHALYTEVSAASTAMMTTTLMTTTNNTTNTTTTTTNNSAKKTMNDNNGDQRTKEYRNKFTVLVSLDSFTEVQSRVLLKLWKILLQAPPKPPALENSDGFQDGSFGGVSGSSSSSSPTSVLEIQDAFLDALCTSLLPDRVTNQTADFVYQMVIQTRGDGGRGSGSGGGIVIPGQDHYRATFVSRLVYGAVFRWMEVISQRMALSRPTVTTPTTTITEASLRAEMLDDGGRGGRGGFSSGSSTSGGGSSEFHQGQTTTAALTPGTTAATTAIISKQDLDQVRLVCLFLQSLKTKGVLEPIQDYVLLYGQLMPYINVVPEAGDLYFSSRTNIGGGM